MPDDEKFSPIRVSTLRGDLEIPFDVYVKVAGKYIHYCRRGDSFEGKRLERLRSKQLTTLFVKPDDEPAYKQYVELNIDSAFKDLNKPLSIRAEVIQGYQEAAISDFLENPLDELTYRHVRASVEKFVAFIMNEPNAAALLLSRSNNDGSITHHGVNVATLAVLIAMQSGVRAGSTLDLLALGCVLHDLDHYHNHLDLSQSIDAMNDEQLKVYRAHPLSGAQRLQSATFVDQLVLTIILQHEENAKGTGFPKGLTENAMDPNVLIAATANAFDRMVSFERIPAKDAMKTLFIDKLGLYPLHLLQNLQQLLKAHGLI